MISIPIISLLLGAAHFLRSNSYGTVITLLVIISLLFSKKNYYLRFVQLILSALSLMWLHLGFTLALNRIAQALPFLRLSLIMLTVFLFTLWSSYLVGKKIEQDQLIIKSDNDRYQIFAMAFTFVLFLLSSFAPFPLMLLPRFFESFLPLQALLMSLYAAKIFQYLIGEGNYAKRRLKLWGIFSLFFFAQLILGINVDSRFLMSGKLHWPIPGLIISANILELKFSIMFIILLISFLLVGPSWCSHLCYVGAIDHWLSTAKNNKKKKKVWQLPLKWRYFFLLQFILIPLLLLLIGPSTYLISITLGLLISLSAIFLAYSYISGKMQHCSLFCPIGTLHSLVSRFHPYKVKIDQHCDQCLQCIKKCSYQALDQMAIKNKAPHSNCTLCLECLGSCHQNSLQLVRGNKGANRKVFLMALAILHTLFLAFARI